MFEPIPVARLRPVKQPREVFALYYSAYKVTYIDHVVGCMNRPRRLERVCGGRGGGEKPGDADCSQASQKCEGTMTNNHINLKFKLKTACNVLNQQYSIRYSTKKSTLIVFNQSIN